ncbi:TlyA family RNA methyltransferase [Candidatus Babeliales bacterium]|nr:TlyA family RNA methyltransferase [Candidatus Babeliales bacterium]
MSKKRLDLLALERFTDLTRREIQSFIIQRKVKVDGKIVDKAGTLIKEESKIEVDAEKPKYVSRAGFKLEHALKYFNFDVTGLVVLDAGISTGGFTDCLLQAGAKKIYGVDVGIGQVHEKIRNDKRVILLEKTNLRHLEFLPEKVDLVTLDLSFISILKVMPAISKLVKSDSTIITLIKPQFEAERKDIRRGGVVKDESVYERVIEKLKEGMKEFDFNFVGITESPVRGAKSGNLEFLALWKNFKTS